MTDFDFCYEMTDFYGDTVTIYGDNDGPAYVEYFDYDAGERRTHTCKRGENQAYIWAYNRGYRD